MLGALAILAGARMLKWCTASSVRFAFPRLEGSRTACRQRRHTRAIAKIIYA